MPNVPYDILAETLKEALLKAGYPPVKALRLSALFADNSAEGSSTHGVARFMRMIKNTLSGNTDPIADAEKVAGFGGMEVWDGHFGAGALIAEDAAARAVELSKSHGIACVSVRNTNHWMRPGRYGMQMADAGVMGICWSNTMPNMPAWGAVDSRIGNNPVVFAVPRKGGNVLIDMSMSQFSYGKLEVTAQKGELLPEAGGFDREGNLTRDPGEILRTRRVLPMGYWKGSAMSLALDLMAAGMSMGKAVSSISAVAGIERGLSQVFIAIHYTALVDAVQSEKIITAAVDDYLSSVPADAQMRIRFPGQNIQATRERSMREGVPVSDGAWNAIQAFVRENP